MTTNHINHNAETQHESSTGHKTNQLKNIARKAIAPVLVAGAMLTTNEVKAQNTATIDPIHYKTAATPFTIPNLPSGSDFYLAIKAGEEVYITIDDMDTNSGVFYLGSGTPKTINGNIIKINAGDVGNRLVNYKESGVNKTIGLHTNYQADIYGPNGDRPETVRVDAGQTARLSGGPNFGLTPEGGYKWKEINGTYSTPTATDSIKNVSRGTYILRASDGLTRNNDTIAVLDKPAIDGKTKTFSFPTTTTGVNYKVYKFQPAAAGAPMSKAPASIQADSAWVEIPSLAFTGDGNAHTTQLPDLGLYRVGAQRTPATPVEMNLPTLKVDFGTNVIDIPRDEESTTFKQANRELFRDTEVPSIIYSIDGREIGTGISNHITIPGVAPAGVYIVRYTENKQIKTKKIVIK